MRYKSSGSSNFSIVVMGGVSAKRALESLYATYTSQMKSSIEDDLEDLRVRIYTTDLWHCNNEVSDIHTLGIRDIDVESVQVIIKLGHSCGARDRDDSASLYHLPCENELRQRAALGIRVRLELLDELRVSIPILRGEARVRQADVAGGDLGRRAKARGAEATA